MGARIREPAHAVRGAVVGMGARRALAVAGGLALAACASGPPPPPWTEAATARAEALEAHLADLPAPDPAALVVRLAFGPEADLDLYVTDPRHETVYFANTPLRTGGALEADRRCADAPGDTGPRVETVRFDAPQPGTWRAGVDHPEDCTGEAEVVPWVLSIEHGGERRTVRGLARRLVFTPIAAEWSLPGEPGRPAAGPPAPPRR